MLVVYFIDAYIEMNVYMSQDNPSLGLEFNISLIQGACINVRANQQTTSAKQQGFRL